jgi:hypothetical protein
MVPSGLMVTWAPGGTCPGPVGGAASTPCVRLVGLLVVVLNARQRQTEGRVQLPCVVDVDDGIAADGHLITVGVANLGEQLHHRGRV